jgi:hypothetical protein
MRRQKDLLMTVIIMTNPQVKPPGPTGIFHKLIWEVRLLEGQEGIILINQTTCALSRPRVVSFRYCLDSEVRAIAHLGPTTLVCSGQFKDCLSNVYGQIPWTWNDCGGPSRSYLQYWSCVDFASWGAWEGAPTKGQGVSIQRLTGLLPVNNI